MSHSSGIIEGQKLSQEVRYDQAKRMLLGDIVPAEDTSGCFGKY